MYVNVAVLKETQPHERRVALVPSVVPKLIKLGAKLHMQNGAGDAIKLADAAFKDVVFIADRKQLVADADLVLAVQPPALDVIDAMKEGAILICFIYANHQSALLKRLLEKKITCFAMEMLPRITRAQSMDALSSQSALAGYYAVQLGATHLRRILPKLTTAAGAIGPAKVLVMGLGGAGLEALADQKPDSGLAPRAGAFERYQLMEILNYISSEVHKGFSPLFNPETSAEEKAAAKTGIGKRLDWLTGFLGSKTHLLGNTFTVADAYLFTVLSWTGHVGIDLNKWPALAAYHSRIAQRPKVQQALKEEGLRK